MDKLATKEQISRIVHMYASDELPHGETQKFIAAHTKKRKNGRFVDRRISYWEKRFPGAGEMILEVLKPFYGWERVIRPALPDLDDRVRKAIFWCDVKGVRRISASKLLWNAESIHATIKTSIGQSMAEWSKEATSDKQELKSSLADALRGSLDIPDTEQIWGELLNTLWLILATDLPTVSVYKPLHELWLNGNFPEFLDKDGNILVLVA